jgi:hypothetical protein
MTSNFGTVAINPGFVPDPATARGTSGGSIDASTWNPMCRGYVTAQPDHIFTAGGMFTSLRILAQSAQDVTLVVQKPDGTFVCNDDSEGTNPIVAGTVFPPGNYKVWVGSYQAGVNAPYVLGFTELGSVTAASLH